MMTTAQRLAVLICVAIGAGSEAYAGQRNEPSRLADASLEELMSITITTATQTAEGVAEAPAKVHVVSARQIETRGYRSVLDVLRDLSEFKVEVGGDPDYPSQLTVQGTYGANLVLLLLDGIRVSSPTNEPLPILVNYPVHHARQIEILYGPASALYGADAFSAVINIISRDGSDSPGLRVSTAAGQYGLYNQTASYGRRLGRDASLMVAGQFFYDRQPDLTRFFPEDFGGLEGQRTGTFNTIYGPMSPSRPVLPEYEAPVSAHSVHATLTAGGLRLMLFQNQSQFPTTFPYNPDNAIYTADAFARNSLVVASGVYRRRFGSVTSTSTLTFSRHELAPQSGYWNVYTNMQRSYKYGYGSMMKAEEQLAWKPFAGATLTTGAAFERFFAIPQGADLNAPVVSQQRPGTILGTTIVDDFIKLRYSNVGAYAQLQYAITPRLSAIAGARGDDNTRYGSTFNPRIGVVARPDDGRTLKLLYGSAFLAPSPYQANAHWGSFYSTDGGITYQSDFWQVPNPALQPQLKRTVEAQFLQSLGNRFVLSASAFRSWFTDLIQQSDPNLTYSGLYKGWPVAFTNYPVNDGREEMYGGSVGVEYVKSWGRDRRVEARGALSAADGEVRDDRFPSGAVQVGGMAPLQVRLGADVEWGRWSVAPRVAVVGRQRLFATEPDNPAVRRTLDGYTTLDVHVRRRRVFRNVSLFATIENALDARYRHINPRAYNNPEELIGAPQNPRRIIAGFDLRLR